MADTVMIVSLFFVLFLLLLALIASYKGGEY